MGRYYSGDINGKFWFGVQSSNDATFFGGEEIEPNYLEYYFDETHMKQIEEGVRRCREELGGFKEKLDEYFEAHAGYGDESLAKAMQVSKKEALRLLEWYARFELGEKIQKRVARKGSCQFEAEL